MIHGDTNIQWLDINKNIFKYDHISKLFQSYIEKSKNENDHILGSINIINFDKDDKVKVKDWYGWSDVIRIIKTNYTGNLYCIRTNSNSLLITESGLFPIYDPEHPVRGFHGEIKFPYEIKNVKDLKNGEIGRVWKNKNISGDLEEFPDINVSIHKKDPLNVYWIITKSGFFNANNFHLSCNTHHDQNRNFK